MTIHPQLQLVFDAFDERVPGTPVAIVGSAVRDFEQAHDIDVLVPQTVNWPVLMRRLGTKYNGWGKPGHHVRRANLRIEGVSKQVQVLQRDESPTFASHPHAVLLPSGEVLNGNAHFQKSTPTFPRR